MLSYPKMFHVKRMRRRGRKTEKAEKRTPHIIPTNSRAPVWNPREGRVQTNDPLTVSPVWTLGAPWARSSGGTSGYSTNQRLVWHTWSVSDGKLHQLEAGFVPSQGVTGGQPSGLGVGQGIASLTRSPGHPSCQAQTPELQDVSRRWPNLVPGNWFT